MNKELLKASLLSYMVEFPVELCWFVIFCLTGVLTQEQHQTAVVHIQGVVVSVHLCGRQRKGNMYKFIAIINICGYTFIITCFWMLATANRYITTILTNPVLFCAT